MLPSSGSAADLAEPIERGGVSELFLSSATMEPYEVLVNQPVVIDNVSMGRGMGRAAGRVNSGGREGEAGGRGGRRGRLSNGLLVDDSRGVVLPSVLQGGGRVA